VFLAILAVAVAAAFLVAFGQSEEDYVFGGGPNVAVNAGTFLFVLAGWGVSLCLHEFGHAYVAYRGGDHEVRIRGYLTLDPRRYTDPVFSLVLPLIFVAIGGIPLPGGAVWINHHSLRSKKVETMVSLAGPLSNLVLGGLLILSINVFDPNLPLAGALSFLALLQVMAFVLNILPIPGLDGWGAIEPYLSPEAQRFGQKARPWAPLILFMALFAFPGVSAVFFDISNTIYNAVGGSADFASLGNYAFFCWRH